MAICKCKMCGGDLLLNGPNRVAECEYCGTRQTVPGADSEKKVTLFNRANRLRVGSEFDRAAALYEQLAAEFPEEAEAYWGVCLCNYGIEYVDDPATGKKIPTCHRAGFTKLTEDENFRLVMKYADAQTGPVYLAQAKEIDRINADILSVSKNEKPYDVFICCKETDEYGSRTPDSVLAQEIYDALTPKGYKVFFSRISLEDKLGVQFEPYIFAALNSARIMLAVGTKYEHFHAVWVKNEWSRFLRLAAKDKTKHLIPCYRDMDPYDMPDEFKGLQAQDMGKLGAVQDLRRGVEKLLPKAEQPRETAAVAVTVDSLLRRASIFMSNGDWPNACAYCNKALDISPENARANELLLLAENGCTDMDALYKLDTEYDRTSAFQNAYRFADMEGKRRLDTAVLQRNERRAAKKKEDLYIRASALSTNKNAPGSLREAAEYFRQLGDYRDSRQRSEAAMAEYCALVYANAARLMGSPQIADRIRALDLLRQIPEYRDASRLYGELLQSTHREQEKEIARTDRELKDAMQTRAALSEQIERKRKSLAAAGASYPVKLQKRDRCRNKYENIFRRRIGSWGALLFFVLSPPVAAIVIRIVQNDAPTSEQWMYIFIGDVVISIIDAIVRSATKGPGIAARLTGNLFFWPLRLLLKARIKKYERDAGAYGRIDDEIRKDTASWQMTGTKIQTLRQRLRALNGEHDTLCRRHPAPSGENR